MTEPPCPARMVHTTGHWDPDDLAGSPHADHGPAEALHLGGDLRRHLAVVIDPGGG